MSQFEQAFPDQLARACVLHDVTIINGAARGLRCHGAVWQALRDTLAELHAELFAQTLKS
jgi:hypothetical protein